MLWVAAGGFLGTLCRYLLARALPSSAASWPWGTLLVNLLGSFLLGVLLEALARSGRTAAWKQRARLLVGTGFCGGFTTYSALAVEVVAAGRAHHPGLAVGYLAASVVLGVLAAVAGMAVGAVRSR